MKIFSPLRPYHTWPPFASLHETVFFLQLQRRERAAALTNLKLQKKTSGREWRLRFHNSGMDSTNKHVWKISHLANKGWQLKGWPPCSNQITVTSAVSSRTVVAQLLGVPKMYGKKSFDCDTQFFVDLCGKSWLFLTLCWGTRSGRGFLQLWAQADPDATARRQNQVLLSLSDVQKSVMYVWNWLATHCVAGWCCMEREITKISSPNNSKWSRAWRDALQISEIKRCCDNLDLPDSDLWSVDGSLRSVMCLCCDCNSSCHGRSGQKHVESKKSHGDHEEIEHGLENTLGGLPISSNILKYRTSKNRKRSQWQAKPMVQFLCLWVQSCPHLISKASPTVP